MLIYPILQVVCMYVVLGTTMQSRHDIESNVPLDKEMIKQYWHDYVTGKLGPDESINAAIELIPNDAFASLRSLTVRFFLNSKVAFRVLLYHGPLYHDVA